MAQLIDTIKPIPFALRSKKTEPKSKNIYLRALSSFYQKVGENTSYTCLQKIAKRLKMSKNDRPVVQVSEIVKALEGSVDKVAVVVAKVVDDVRVLEIPSVKIVALQWSRSVKEKVEKYNGSIVTLDQLFKVCPNMENVVLVAGDKFKRKSAKHWFGNPGDKNSKVYPKQIAKRAKNGEKRVKMKQRKGVKPNKFAPKE